MFLNSLDSSVFLYLFCRFRLNYLKQQQQKQQQNSVTNNERFFPSYISAVNLTNEPGNVKIAFRLFLLSWTITPEINHIQLIESHSHTNNALLFLHSLNLRQPPNDTETINLVK